MLHINRIQIRSVHAHLFVSLIFILYSLFLIVYSYPSTDGFSFLNLLQAGYLENGEILNVFSHSIPGFVALTYIISEVSNIPYNVLLTLPLLIPSIFLLIIAILRRIANNTLLWVLIFFIFVSYVSGSQYTLFCHSIGFVLFLSSILLIIIRLSPVGNLQDQHWAISIALFIIIISLNYISYLHLFFTLATIGAVVLVTRVSDLFKHSFELKKPVVDFVWILSFGIVFILTFNGFFYGTFISKITSQSSITSGFDKVFKPFVESGSQDLDKYSLIMPSAVNYAHLISVAILSIGILICCVFIAYKLFRDRKISVSEQIFASIVISYAVVFIIYSIIGQILINLIILIGVLAFALLMFNARGSTKSLVIGAIILVISLNLFSDIVLYNNDFPVTGTKDDNFYNYMEAPAKWYSDNLANQEISGAYSNKATDVFTTGYFMFDGARRDRDISYYPYFFSPDDIRYILNSPTINPEQKAGSSLYIINYKEHDFSIEGWKIFQSWSKSREVINNNPQLTKIYCTNDVDFYFS